MYERKPWLAFYEPHVPPQLDYPDTNLPAALEDAARRFPEHPAMMFKNRKVSYREFDVAVRRLSAALQDLGVTKGDRVAIHLPNCPQFPITYMAVLRIGGIAVPCNPTYTAREMRHQLLDSGAELVVTLSSLYPLITTLRKDIKLRHVIVAKIKTYFPWFLRLLFTLARERKMGHRVDISGDPNTSWFADLIGQARGGPKPVAIDWDDTAVLVYTGGTTGVSKGA